MASNSHIVGEYAFVSARRFRVVDTEHEQIVHRRSVLVLLVDHKRLVGDLNKLFVVVVDAVYEPFQAVYW